MRNQSNNNTQNKFTYSNGSNGASTNGLNNTNNHMMQYNTVDNR